MEQYGRGATIRNVTDGGDIETFDNLTERGTNPGQIGILPGNELNMVPSAPLPAGKEIAILIDAGIIEATDGTAFAGIADETTFSFTIAAGDTISPGLTGLSVDTVGTTTADASVDVTITAGETGVDLHYLVTLAADAQPGRSNVLASPAFRAVVTSGTQVIILTGLTSDTEYRLSACVEGTAGNKSGVQHQLFTTTV